MPKIKFIGYILSLFLIGYEQGGVQARSPLLVLTRAPFVHDELTTEPPWRRKKMNYGPHVAAV